MKKVEFTKTVGSGNDFVVVESGTQCSVSGVQSLVKKMCDRKYGVGADGLLLLAKSLKADVKMRIFNADGSEADMCGNGARCVALYASHKVPPKIGETSPALPAGTKSQGHITIETRAGIIGAEVKGDNVKINLTDPKDIKLDIPIKVNNRSLRVNFINTGVPHAVVFVEGLAKIDVQQLGKLIRNHKRFSPVGTNVNFVQVAGNDSIYIRTYERGVEGETLACGTGSVASSLVFALKAGIARAVKVHTAGGEVLKVYFDRTANNFKNVWLEGIAKIICKGEYYV